MQWRDLRDERWRLLRQARARAEADEERPWRARALPKQMRSRLAELRQAMPAHEATMRLMTEAVGRIRPLGRRQWAVPGFGPGWGTSALRKRSQ